MKFIKYITFFALPFLSTDIAAMQGLQTDFSKPSKDVVLLESKDHVVFIVDADLAQSSNTISNLINIAGLEDRIELPNVKAKNLEQLLILSQGTLQKGLTIGDLVDLVEAERYLDMAAVKGALLEEINRKLTWNQDAFEKLFNSQLRHEDKIRIIQAFAQKIGLNWTMEMLTELLNYPIHNDYKMTLVRKLIEQNRGLLITFVDDWNVNVKRLKGEGKDPMTSGYLESKPTAEDKQLHDSIEKLLGQNYQLVKQRLLEEYPDR